MRLQLCFLICIFLVQCNKIMRIPHEISKKGQYGCAPVTTNMVTKVDTDTKFISSKQGKFHKVSLDTLFTHSPGETFADIYIHFSNMFLTNTEQGIFNHLIKNIDTAVIYNRVELGFFMQPKESQLFGARAFCPCLYIDSIQVFPDINIINCQNTSLKTNKMGAHSH